MKIEAGKYYRSHEGEKKGPMVRGGSDPDYPWTDGINTWATDGQYLLGVWSPSRNLVAEWDERAAMDGDPQPAGNTPDAYADAARDALAEVRRAKAMWPRNFASAHEGFAVTLEEFDELRAHVWTNQKRRDLSAMRKEAIQVAAMALRFAAECCDEETGRK